MTIDQLSIFIENKPGKLVEAVEALAEAGIDLRALSLADATDFGILRIIADKPTRALNVMQERGYLVKPSKVIPVSVGDAPGGLAAVLRVLADANIDVEYTYAFVAHEKNKAYVVLRTGDNDAAVKVLTDKGVNVVSGEEMYGM